MWLLSNILSPFRGTIRVPPPHLVQRR